VTPSPGCTMTARRLLFVFHWLVVGGEETEVRLLARHLRPDWSVDVVVCHRRPGMPRQTHDQLSGDGVPVDTTAYGLPDEQVVAHLASILPATTWWWPARRCRSCTRRCAG